MLSSLAFSKEYVRLASEVSKNTEPYQILFIAGALSAMTGASLWLLFAFGKLNFYPKTEHGNIMFFALLWSFISGFLMTAIPKMTSTKAASRLEISLALLLVSIQLILNFTWRENWPVYIFTLQTAFLILFVVRRFLVFRKIPFSGFIFLPIAFLQILIGLIFYFSGDDSGNVDRRALMLLACDAFVLNLIVGLGSRLIPVISRMPNALSPVDKSMTEQWGKPLAVALLLNSGYWIELAGYAQFGIMLRVFGLLVSAVFTLGLFSSPSKWSAIGIGLKFSFAAIILGHLISLLLPGADLAVAHLTYIGGFTALTFLISTRVMLAHGDQPLTYELQSKRIFSIWMLMLLAAGSRFLAGPNPISYWLMGSAALFIVAILIWTDKFLRILYELRFRHERRS